MDKTKFLARVREAAHAGRAFRVHTQPIPAGTGYVGGGEDLCAHFAAEINAVGGEALIVPDRAAARLELERLLQQYAVRTAVAWQHPVLDRIGLEACCLAAGIQVEDYVSLAARNESDQRARILAADVGITSCQWAIAETGTLVMCHRPGRERVASLAPPVHIAIVEAEQILPDLFDVFAQLQLPNMPGRPVQPEFLPRPEGRLPANITLITGPSKTGDIELQLTTGVHGPKHWHVIIIRTS